MAEINYVPDPRALPLTWTPSRQFGNSGIGVQQVYNDPGGPPAAPDDPTQPALWYDPAGGPILEWIVSSQSWL